MLVDFGLARASPALMRTRAGTLLYAAPEVFFDRGEGGAARGDGAGGGGGGYDASVDVWSLGVMGFLMLCGAMPFPHLTSEVRVCRVSSYY